jgi:hypothetical protein
MPPVSSVTSIRLDIPVGPMCNKFSCIKLVSTKTNSNCQREKNDGYQRRSELNHNPQTH